MKLVLLIFILGLSSCTATNPFQDVPTVEELKKPVYSDSKN
jgi:hypothetical protein